MSHRSRRAAPVLALAAMLAPQPALPHAAVIEAEATRAIRLHATYDTGAPMAGAQVIIYAPDAPAEAWGQGLTDADGRFVFVPDAHAGRWSVQVRQAGHGVMAHVEMTGEAPVLLTARGPAPWTQRALMVALVGWGALGTVLFALRDRGRSWGSTGASTGASTAGRGAGRRPGHTGHEEQADASS